MTSIVEKPDHISQAEWDSVGVPELTDDQLAQLRPMVELFPEQVAAQKSKGGRPKLNWPQREVSWRLSADVVDAVEATGPGYNSRVDAILRRAIAEGSL